VTEICAGNLRRRLNGWGPRPKGPRITVRIGRKGRRSVVALHLPRWYAKTSYRVVTPSEASAEGTRMEAPQTAMGCSLAYDRVIFHKVTAQVMNLLVEVDELSLENGLPLSHADQNDLKFTTINHWHLCQFSAKRGVQCATATAVLSIPTAPRIPTIVHLPWQAPSCPVLYFGKLVQLCLTCIVINIMHIHEAFHFFLISKKLPCFTLHVDGLSLMKIYSMHALFYYSCGFSSVTHSYKCTI